MAYPRGVERCTKCGSERFFQEAPDEWHCLICGWIYYIRPDGSPMKPLSKARETALKYFRKIA